MCVSTIYSTAFSGAKSGKQIPLLTSRPSDSEVKVYMGILGSTSTPSWNRRTQYGSGMLRIPKTAEHQIWRKHTENISYFGVKHWLPTSKASSYLFNVPKYQLWLFHSRSMSTNKNNIQQLTQWYTVQGYKYTTNFCCKQHWSLINQQMPYTSYCMRLQATNSSPQQNEEVLEQPLANSPPNDVAKCLQSKPANVAGWKPMNLIWLKNPWQLVKKKHSKSICY